MLERDVWVVLRDLGNDFAPQLRRLENVRFIHRGHVLASSLRRFERDARDADDLLCMVRKSVDRLPILPLARDATGLSKVQPSGELAHDQKVDALERFRLKG